MKLDKTNINLEKIGNIEIFSCDGYILGFRDKKYSDCISLFPIVINTDNYEQKTLEMYFDFIDILWTYSDYDYFPNYDVYFKKYNKVYRDRSKYDIKELVGLSLDCDVCVIPEYSFELVVLINNFMEEFSQKDDRFTKDLTQDNKVTTITLFLDDDNYIKISVNYFEQYFMAYNSTSSEMDDIVKIFEYIFKMLDKNLQR